MTLPLSVVIIAKNEAANLPRCLASVRGWVAEMVVALNDTTDGSDVIARDFGASVHHVRWQGYRDTKNDALELARHDWVLSLDADEEVSSALRADLVAFFARADRDRPSECAERLRDRRADSRRRSGHDRGSLLAHAATFPAVNRIGNDANPRTFTECTR